MGDAGAAALSETLADLIEQRRREAKTNYATDKKQSQLQQPAEHNSEEPTKENQTPIQALKTTAVGNQSKQTSSQRPTKGPCCLKPPVLLLISDT